MTITRIGSAATLLAATLGSFATSQAAEGRSAAARMASGSQTEQKTALFGLFGCGSNCGYGCGCGYRACNPCGSYGGCYPRPVYGGYGGCGPSYGGCGPSYGGCGYYGSPVVTSPIYGVPSYGGGCGPYNQGYGPGYGYGYSGYGAPVYGAPGMGAPMYGPYGSRSTTPSIPVVNRREKFRSTAFEDDQDSPFYP